MDRREFVKAVILRGKIGPAEVNLTPKRARFQPARPHDESYMRGWHQVGQRVGRER